MQPSEWKNILGSNSANMFRVKQPLLTIKIKIRINLIISNQNFIATPLYPVLCHAQGVQYKRPSPGVRISQNCCILLTSGVHWKTIED